MILILKKQLLRMRIKKKRASDGGIGGRELSNYEMGKGLWSGWSGRCIAHTYHKGYISTFHCFYYTLIPILKTHLPKQSFNKQWCSGTLSRRQGILLPHVLNCIFFYS